MNNYHIYDEIGRGKGSVVYKGRKRRTIEYVAVKSVDLKHKNRVLNEVRHLLLSISSFEVLLAFFFFLFWVPVFVCSRL